MHEAQLRLQNSYFNNGNAITSRMLEWSVSSMTSLSNPMPIPPVGGIPYSRAVMKSSSTETCICNTNFAAEAAQDCGQQHEMVRVSINWMQTWNHNIVRAYTRLCVNCVPAGNCTLFPSAKPHVLLCLLLLAVIKHPQVFKRLHQPSACNQGESKTRQVQRMVSNC